MYSIKKARLDKEKFTSNKAIKKEIKKVLKEIKYYAKKGYDAYSHYVDSLLINAVTEGLEKLGYEVKKHSATVIDISW